MVPFGADSPAGGEIVNAGRAGIYAMPGTAAYSNLVVAGGRRPVGDRPHRLGGDVASTGALVTPDADYSLTVLAGLISAIPGTELVIARAWLPQPSTSPLPAPTLANVGRSVRLQLWNVTTGARDPALLGTLAGLALAAGFDWVEWTDILYITVSTRPDACQTDVDILFLIDGSGSIQAAWPDEIDFVASVARYFQIGPNRTRAAAITYSGESVIDFDFDDHPTAASVLGAIRGLRHPDGGTATHLALNDATRMFTNASYGARLDNPAIPKLCLLITDGGSNNGAATQAAAAELRSHDVAVFAIGAGNIDMTELNGVATDPDGDHVVTISSAANIGNLVDRIASSTCVQAALIADCIQVNDTVQPGEFRYFTPSFSAGSVLIEVASITGNGVSVYISGTDDSPGPFYHDMAATATASGSAVLVVNRTALGGNSGAIYMSVMGLGDGTVSAFTVETFVDVLPVDAVTVPAPQTVPANYDIYDLSTAFDNSERTIQFSLSPQSSDAFTVTALGVVKTVRELTFDGVSQFSLQVIASSETAPCVRGAVDITFQGPTTRSPTTSAPTTRAPTTSSPATRAPTTLSPGTQAPTTGAPSAAPTTSTPSAAPTEWSFDGINLRPPTLTSPGLQEIDTDLALGTPFVTIVATHPSGNAGTITYSIAPTTAVAEADRRARRSEITTPFNISETDGSVFTAAALTPGNLTVVVTATVTVGTVSNSSAITLPVLVVQGPNSANSDAASSDDESMGGGGVAAIVLVILACFALLMFLMFKQVRDNNRSRKDPGIDNPTYAGDVLTNPVYADAGKVADESMYADASGTRAGAVPNQNYAPLGRDGLATNPNYAPAERRPEAAADGEGLYGTPINDQQQHYADLEGEAYRDVAPNPAGEDGDTYKDVAPTPAGNSAADDEAYGYLAAEGATNDPYMDPAPTKTNAAVADEGNLYGEVLPAGAVASMPSRVPPALPAAAPPSTASMPYDNYADGEADGMYAAPAVMAAGPSTITYDAATAASHTPGSTARPKSIILGEDGTFHPSNQPVAAPRRPRLPTLSVVAGRPLPKNWHEATDAEGVIYFYNSVTQESSWERPVTTTEVETMM